MIPKKPAPDLIRDGSRFSLKIMLQLELYTIYQRQAAQKRCASERAETQELWRFAGQRSAAWAVEAFAAPHPRTVHVGRLPSFVTTGHIRSKNGVAS
jgi:hypothetical protein